MGIKAVIFDLGGVLVRTETLEPRQRLAERLGLSYDALYHAVFDAETAIQATLGKVSAAEHWQSVREGLGLPADEQASLQQEFFDGDILDQELVAYIRSLRPRYQTALLSNAWDNLRSMLAGDWNILDAFDQVVISAEVGVAKPVAAIYHIVVERLGVAPQEAVFVDDVVHNLEAAQAVGLRTVHFKNRQQALSELQVVLAECAND